MQFSPTTMTQDYSQWSIPNNFGLLNQEELLSGDNYFDKSKQDRILIESLTVDTLRAILQELYEVYRSTVVDLHYENKSYFHKYTNLELDDMDKQNKSDELDYISEIDTLDKTFESDELDELDTTFELDENYVDEELDEQSILEDARFNEKIKSLYTNINIQHESAFAQMAEEKFNPSNTCLEEFLYVINNNQSYGILNVQNVCVFFELAKYFELEWLINDCRQFFNKNCSGVYTQTLNDFLGIDANRFIKK